MKQDHPAGRAQFRPCEGYYSKSADAYAQLLLDHETAPHTTERGGRKAHRLVLEKELGEEAVEGGRFVDS